MTNKNYKFAADFSGGAIDKEKGEIKGVSILSIGEVNGHGVSCDLGTLKSLLAAVKGKAIKSYVNHSYSPDVTDTIGLFSAFYLSEDQKQIKGTFTALKAFRAHETKAFDILFEMAELSPEAFGVSINFSGSFIYYEGEQEKEYMGGDFDVYSRVSKLHSIDYVDHPAINPTGLFSAENEKFMEEENKKLKEDIEEAKAEIEEMKTKLETAEKAKAETEAKYSTLESEFSAYKTSGNEIVKTNSDGDILSQYQAFSDTNERLAFFRKHKETLLGKRI